MRLMCSQDRAEVEAVKNELFKVGIAAEARKHPIAEALGINGLELWVQDERDFCAASEVYARMRGCGLGKDQEPQATAAVLSLEPIEPLNGNDEGLNPDLPPGGEPREELEQASSLLEKEIEEMLKRESGLAVECESLRKNVKELGQVVAEGHAALDREIESRAATEKKQAEELSGLQTALDCERAERARAEEQFDRERQYWQQEVKSRDQSLNDLNKELESKSELIQAHQVTVADLKKEVVALELQWEENERLLSKAREELSLEREGRQAAEEQLERAAEAQKTLEQRLLDQNVLQQQMQSHVASINSLCSRLQAKRIAMVQQEP